MVHHELTRVPLSLAVGTASYISKVSAVVCPGLSTPRLTVALPEGGFFRSLGVSSGTVSTAEPIDLSKNAYWAKTNIKMTKKKNGKGQGGMVRKQ